MVNQKLNPSPIFLPDIKHINNHPDIYIREIKLAKFKGISFRDIRLKLKIGLLNNRYYFCLGCNKFYCIQLGGIKKHIIKVCSHKEIKV